MIGEHAFLWALPAVMALAVALQLYAGRVMIGWAPSGWRYAEKINDPGRYWLFIAAELLATLILIGQAATA